MRERKIVVRRRLNADLESVFRAWTCREEVAKWLSCGPSRELLRIEAWSGRVGENISVYLQGDDDGQIRISGKFIVLNRPRQLEYEWGPNQDRVRVEFSEVANGTEIVVEQTVSDIGTMNSTLPSVVKEGWEFTFEQLASHME